MLESAELFRGDQPHFQQEQGQGALEQVHEEGGDLVQAVAGEGADQQAAHH